MKCLICKNEGVKYIVKKPSFNNKESKKNYVRTDFTAKCSRCGWTGDVR